MLNAKAFANAATAVMAVFYVVCAALSFFAPDLIFNIAKSWMHSVNIESIKSTFNPDIATLLWGLVTLSAIAWVTTYSTIALYNKWAKKS